MSLGDDHQSSGDYGGAGRTRLRLPEDEGGPRRGGRSSSRSLVTVVGVVVLLIAAIAFANRGGSDSASGEDGDGDKPKTSATAPSGTRPVQSGFAHDAQGAQSAAANYAVTLVSADIFKPDRRDEIVRQVFVADKQAALTEKFDKVYSQEFLSTIGLDKNGNATGGNTYVSRTMPIGTKATQYSDTTATVDVWCTGVFGTAGEKTTTPVSSDWFTMTLQLRWVDSDWKVESFSQKDGPAPVPGDNKASSSDELSKAVQEYGGFTYAR
ncbi:hypothetical protein ACFYO6_34660 [Streptomyces anthocyanicus]|uniref:DUF8175 domain-containing protein n=1 Tax=Streptomyces anthocyanicus TaxID=68174 RepID=A0ABZ1M0C3_9ACTN|nr:MULTISPECIES: hypothetical protein [Streptomyces]THA83624.1 hypothetical protein E6R61_33975 [Streptomyces sp. LRa12]WSB61960.1 hypothetical protein OIE72_17590 [Streptomyces anthocyanicus]WTC10157.1 hypothetical protein OHA15_21190 [Streptomyces anthocyanicus]